MGGYGLIWRSLAPVAPLRREGRWFVARQDVGTPKTRRIATGMGNSQLSAAKKAKNDEFYTRMTDIEHELVHYKEHFRDKVVLCNCDDPFESNFLALLDQG